MRKRKLKLLCRECGETCNLDKGCDAYAEDPDNSDHVHLAGGHREYGLCKICLDKFYLRHRPKGSDGKYHWLKKCQENCGFCKLMTAP